MIFLVAMATLLTTGCGELLPSQTGGGGSGGSTPGSTTGFVASCDNGPLDAPVDGCSPAPLPTTGNLYEDCARRVNQLRWECQCLPPLDRWVGGESCADQQAAYDSTRGAHAGFSDGICSPRGRGQNECPGWGSTDQVISGCLQSMWNEGQGDNFAAHGHYINMTNPAHSRVACGFHTTDNGEVWAVQNFE